MDVNFRLKNQLVSSFLADPGLGIGMAYMVLQEPYESYVLSRAQDADVSPFESSNGCSVPIVRHV